jgi:two-component system, NtrC family, response regulator AtoC
MLHLDTSRYPLLIVDDEQDNLDAFRFAFRRSFSLNFALGPQEALANLESIRPAVVVTDQRMPGMTGIELLKIIKERLPETVGILLTAYTDLPVLLEAIHSGSVHRYVQKPWDSKELATILRQAIERYSVLEENRMLRERLARYAGYLEQEQQDPMGFGELSGDSQASRELESQIAQHAASNSSLLVMGEEGVRKRTVARAVHTQSQRESRPFVTMSAAAFGADEQVRELCGWEQGVFPWAAHDRLGRLALADGGTLLISDVHRLGLQAQQEVLDLLTTGHCKQIGAKRGKPVDVRLMISSQENLRNLSMGGTILDELKQRLEQFTLRVPTLRDRRSDVPKLAEHMLTKLALRYGHSVKSVDDSAMEKLVRYDWPGNVRELETVMERAAILCQGATIETQHLAFLEAHPEKKTIVVPSVAQGTADHIDLPEQLEDLERRELYAALEKCKGNKAEVARMLGVQRTTLYYRMKRLGINF